LKVQNVRNICVITNLLRFVITYDFPVLLQPFYLPNENNDVEVLGLVSSTS